MNVVLRNRSFHNVRVGDSHVDVDGGIELVGRVVYPFSRQELRNRKPLTRRNGTVARVTYIPCQTYSYNNEPLSRTNISEIAYQASV